MQPTSNGGPAPARLPSSEFIFWDPGEEGDGGGAEAKAGQELHRLRRVASTDEDAEDDAYNYVGERLKLEEETCKRIRVPSAVSGLQYGTSPRSRTSGWGCVNRSSQRSPRVMRSQGATAQIAQGQGTKIYYQTGQCPSKQPLSAASLWFSCPDLARALQCESTAFTRRRTHGNRPWSRRGGAGSTP